MISEKCLHRFEDKYGVYNMIIYVVKDNKNETNFVTNEVNELIRFLHNNEDKEYFILEMWLNGARVYCSILKDVHKYIAEDIIKFGKFHIEAYDAMNDLDEDDSNSIIRSYTNYETDIIKTRFNNICKEYNITEVWTNMKDIFANLYRTGSIVLVVDDVSKIDRVCLENKIKSLFQADWEYKKFEDLIDVLVISSESIIGLMTPFNRDELGFYKLF